MNKVMKEIISTLLYLLGVLCLTWLVITFVGQRTEVDGASMEPTLNNGDNLIVDKISYRFRDPQRFDIIVFPVQEEMGIYVQEDKETYYIKRIIGLPGETVQIDQAGNIYINGEVLQENYGKEIISAQNIGCAANPIVLGKDEYFVMGDNRNNSTDSRRIGNIKRKDIVGRAWVRIWPFSDIGVLRHQ